MTAQRYLRFEAKPGENAWLDLVRATAIVLVLLRHGQAALSRTSGEPPTLIETIFLNGWIGVDIFFVLSGYLIGAHLLRQTPGTFSWRTYLRGRALRILPAYVAALFLTAFAVFPLFSVDATLLTLRVAYHLVFLQDYLPANINVVFWSLGVEEKFYLIVPLVAAAVLAQKTTTRRIVFIIGIIVFGSLLRGMTYLTTTHPLDYAGFFRALRSPFHMCLEPLFGGLLIAVAEREGLLNRFARKRVAIGTLSAALLLVAMSSYDFMATISTFDAIGQPLMIASLAVGITASAVLITGVTLPGTGGVRVLARLSYCLYLIHFPLIPLAQALAAGDAAKFWFSYLALSLFAAAALHFLVEKPFLLIKDCGVILPHRASAETTQGGARLPATAHARSPY